VRREHVGAMFLFHYETGVGDSGRQLSRHAQRLVGDIAALDVPENWDSNEPRDLLVASDGSVIFGGGYHIWLIATMDEKVILSCGGPDDGEPLLMMPYRSDLGGLCLGTRGTGDVVKIGALKHMICEICKQQPISSMSMQKVNRKHISQDRK
jgi:hypothetical protein